MGDVIMSSPAMRALKESFGSRITLLTSPAGSIVVPYLSCVDDVIVAALPWVKSDGMDSGALLALTGEIQSRSFDAAIIFTVYSQSALPAGMLAYMAGIPVRVAYARENPYDLLTHWAPDQEPYAHIMHQVERDLSLVKMLGAHVAEDRLLLEKKLNSDFALTQKLEAQGIGDAFIILHPGVSETKREYPAEYWIAVGKLLADAFGMPLLVTGSGSEKTLAYRIAAGIGEGAVSLAGTLNLGEFIALVGRSVCVVSVNTGTIHIAAAMQTPAVVLYAQTNPQHTPWKSPHALLPFSVPVNLRSKNPVIRHVADRLYTEEIPFPEPQRVFEAVRELLAAADTHLPPAVL
ncbi:ADP-heptose:LPS heptosyltransferase [Dyadobacter soli]|uniref:ADP-heptose:LPS heptosyltransferase n=2 Tax=Dyadobacter soli TaxID=659014 RepID=A0A1G7D4C0_9BACT|nr:ADP-heptose:LPS heptosyltransferase [Dyadobacter soli]